MSRTPSSRPPRRSSAAKAEDPADESAHLIAAGRFLAERRSFGMVWIDADLVVRRCLGPLVDFVAVDRPVTESVMALIGFETELTALRDGDGRPLTIPNIIMNGQIGHEDEPPLRLSFDIFWAEREQCHLMLVRNVMDYSSLESELRTQMRLRAIAEADLVEKSEAIQRANQELALVNRDLEEFAYVISHDLKAPLRALRYDSGDADRALVAGDVATVGDKLAAMRGHQARMLGMLNGLFDYARAGHKADTLEEVETRALVEGIITGLANGSGIAIAVEGDWPRLMTLAPPLELVLRNLIDNAIKHHDRPNGRVRLSAREGSDALEITICDDGPGIPQEWQTAVFLPFRKVGDANNAEDSSGMGLALVRRTLDRIGGGIRLQSDAPHQRGTTFHIRWPKTISA
jgi:signal transduction histidine kinase